MLKIFIPLIIILITLVLLYVGIVLGYATMNQFKPDENESLRTNNPIDKIVISDSDLTLLTWNIGYAGLGREMDFFYEGGRSVRPSRELSGEYMNGIISHIQNEADADFILLQEVDFESKRSYYQNQHLQIESVLPDHSSVYCINYNSAFVPLPWLSPMGRVNSGLSIFSGYDIREAVRMSTPGSHAWPKRLFMPDRCFLKARFMTSSGKELVVFNIHNSAFSDEMDLRNAELNLLREMMLKEYAVGNFVVAGGDWNQNPPGMDIGEIQGYIGKNVWPISHDYFPEGWVWAYDPGLPTNRDVNKPFKPDKTKCTIIDYFLVSPNISVNRVETTDLQFNYSDHHPVKLRIRLLTE